MMCSIPFRHKTKRNINVYQTDSLVDKARSIDMSLSTTLDEPLAKTIEAKQNEQAKEQEDIQAINTFMAKARLLSDDEFFGSL